MLNVVKLNLKWTLPKNPRQETNPAGDFFESHFGKAFFV